MIVRRLTHKNRSMTETLCQSCGVNRFGSIWASRSPGMLPQGAFGGRATGVARRSNALRIHSQSGHVKEKKRPQDGALYLLLGNALHASGDAGHRSASAAEDGEVRKKLRRRSCDRRVVLPAVSRHRISERSSASICHSGRIWRTATTPRRASSLDHDALRHEASSEFLR